MLAQRQTPPALVVDAATTRRIPPPIAPRPRPNRRALPTPAAAADDWDEELDSGDELPTETPRQTELRELASHALTRRGLGNDALRARLEHVFSAAGVQPATPLRRTTPLRTRLPVLPDASSEEEASTSASTVAATAGVHAQSQASPARASGAGEQGANPLAGLRRGRPASPPVRAPLPPRVMQLVGNVHRPAPQAEEHEVRGWCGNEPHLDRWPAGSLYSLIHNSHIWFSNHLIG